MDGSLPIVGQGTHLNREKTVRKKTPDYMHMTSDDRKNLLLASAAVAVTGIAAYALTRRKNYPPLSVHPYVNLERYVGEWYEIARLPTWFERKCYGGTKATYTRRTDGKINVLNTCREGSLNGKIRAVRGKATVADKTTQAKLNVQFFWPFQGNYWIIEVGDNYQYALVGEPSRKYLWILSRTPQLDLFTVERLISRAQSLCFDTQKLLFTRQ